MREGHAPPLHAVRERPAKWDCRGHPGERRAGCPHPAGPRGGGNVPGFEFQRCGGRERPPYGAGETRRPPGKMQFPRPLQTHVGDDARTAPAGAFRRPTGPQVRLLGRRSSQGVRGGAGFAGGINPAPTGIFFVSGKPGGRNVCPGLQGRATALPQGSAAGQAGPIWNRPLHGVFAAAGMFPVLNRQRCGGRERPPYGPRETRRPPGKIQSPRCTVGADSISARFAAARGSAGGINPAPTGKFYVLGHQNAPDSTPP